MYAVGKTIEVAIGMQHKSSIGVGGGRSLQDAAILLMAPAFALPWETKLQGVVICMLIISFLPLPLRCSAQPPCKSRMSELS